MSGPSNLITGLSPEPFRSHLNLVELSQRVAKFDTVTQRRLEWFGEVLLRYRCFGFQYRNLCSTYPAEALKSLRRVALEELRLKLNYPDIATTVKCLENYVAVYTAQIRLVRRHLVLWPRWLLLAHRALGAPLPQHAQHKVDNDSAEILACMLDIIEDLLRNNPYASERVLVVRAAREVRSSRSQLWEWWAQARHSHWGAVLAEDHLTSSSRLGSSHLLLQSAALFSLESDSPDWRGALFFHQERGIVTSESCLRCRWRALRVRAANSVLAAWRHAASPPPHSLYLDVVARFPHLLTNNTPNKLQMSYYDPVTLNSKEEPATYCKVSAKENLSRSNKTDDNDRLIADESPKTSGLSNTPTALTGDRSTADTTKHKVDTLTAITDFIQSDKALNAVNIYKFKHNRETPNNKQEYIASNSILASLLTSQPQQIENDLAQDGQVLVPEFNKFDPLKTKAVISFDDDDDDIKVQSDSEHTDEPMQVARHNIINDLLVNKKITGNEKYINRQSNSKQSDETIQVARHNIINDLFLNNKLTENENDITRQINSKQSDETIQLARHNIINDLFLNNNLTGNKKDINRQSNSKECDETIQVARHNIINDLFLNNKLTGNEKDRNVQRNLKHIDETIQVARHNIINDLLVNNKLTGNENIELNSNVNASCSKPIVNKVTSVSDIINTCIEKQFQRPSNGECSQSSPSCVQMSRDTKPNKNMQGDIKLILNSKVVLKKLETLPCWKKHQTESSVDVSVTPNTENKRKNCCSTIDLPLDGVAHKKKKFDRINSKKPATDGAKKPFAYMTGTVESLMQFCRPIDVRIERMSQISMERIKLRGSLDIELSDDSDALTWRDKGELVPDRQELLHYISCLKKSISCRLDDPFLAPSTSCAPWSQGTRPVGLRTVGSHTEETPLKGNCKNLIPILLKITRNTKQITLKDKKKAASSKARRRVRAPPSPSPSPSPRPRPPRPRLSDLQEWERQKTLCNRFFELPNIRAKEKETRQTEKDNIEVVSQYPLTRSVANIDLTETDSDPDNLEIDTDVRDNNEIVKHDPVEISASNKHNIISEKINSESSAISKDNTKAGATRSNIEIFHTTATNNASEDVEMKPVIDEDDILKTVKDTATNISNNHVSVSPRRSTIIDMNDESRVTVKSGPFITVNNDEIINNIVKVKDNPAFNGDNTITTAMAPKIYSVTFKSDENGCKSAKDNILAYDTDINDGKKKYFHFDRTLRPISDQTFSNENYLIKPQTDSSKLAQKLRDNDVTYQNTDPNTKPQDLTENDKTVKHYSGILIPIRIVSSDGDDSIKLEKPLHPWSKTDQVVNLQNIMIQHDVMNKLLFQNSSQLTTNQQHPWTTNQSVTDPTPDTNQDINMMQMNQNENLHNLNTKTHHPQNNLIVNEVLNQSECKQTPLIGVNKLIPENVKQNPNTITNQQIIQVNPSANQNVNLNAQNISLNYINAIQKDINVIQQEINTIHQNIKANHSNIKEIQPDLPQGHQHFNTGPNISYQSMNPIHDINTLPTQHQLLRDEQMYKQSYTMHTPNMPDVRSLYPASQTPMYSIPISLSVNHTPILHISPYGGIQAVGHMSGVENPGQQPYIQMFQQEPTQQLSVNITAPATDNRSVNPPLHDKLYVANQQSKHIVQSTNDSKGSLATCDTLSTITDTGLGKRMRKAKLKRKISITTAATKKSKTKQDSLSIQKSLPTYDLKSNSDSIVCYVDDVDKAINVNQAPWNMMPVISGVASLAGSDPRGASTSSTGWAGSPTSVLTAPPGLTPVPPPLRGFPARLLPPLLGRQLLGEELLLLVEGARSPMCVLKDSFLVTCRPVRMETPTFWTVAAERMMRMVLFEEQRQDSQPKLKVKSFAHFQEKNAISASEKSTPEELSASEMQDLGLVVQDDKLYKRINKNTLACVLCVVSSPRWARPGPAWLLDSLSGRCQPATVLPALPGQTLIQRHHHYVTFKNITL